MSKTYKEKQDDLLERTAIREIAGGMGKLPPQAVEMEKAVLGAMMLDDRVFTDLPMLRPEHFYLDSHMEVFRAMQQLHMNSKPIDLLTVSAQCKENGTLEIVGGAYYIVELTNAVASAANAEAHSRIIVERFMGRKLIAIGSKMAMECYSGTADPFDLIQNVETSLYNLANGLEENNYSTAQEMGLVILKSAKEKYALKSELSGERFTDISEVDRLISGAEIGDVIGMAGSPSSGKSSFVNAILRYFAKIGKPVLMWSGEMSKEKSAARLTSAISGIGTRRIQQGKFLDSEEETKLIIDTLSNLPDNIYLQSEEKNIAKIISDVKRFKRKGVKTFIYDRSELIEVDYSNSKDLNAYGKTLAKMRKVAVSEGVTFIVLIQTTKQLEADFGIPTLGNIYGGISVTSSFNKILGIINPLVLGMDDWPTKYAELAGGAPVRGHAMINVVKSNDGDDLDKPVLVKFDQYSNTLYSAREPQFESMAAHRTDSEFTDLIDEVF